MKKNTLVFLLLLALLSGFAACGDGQYPQALLTADSLTRVQPAAALSLLDSVESLMLREPEPTLMYYRLLCIKAQDKAYLPHQSDSQIRIVLDYYEGLRKSRHLPEAYYYAGRVYRDLGDAPRALGYFEKALKLLPEGEADRTKSVIYSQMGTLFFFQGLREEALRMFQLSQQCDVALRDSVGMVFNLRDIANMYRELERPDSALFYFQAADRISKSLHRPDLFYMVQSQMASFYTDLQLFDSARIALQYTKKNTNVPIAKSSVYIIAAKFYDKTGQSDSAAWYYRELLPFGTVYAKRTAYRWLTQQAARRHDFANFSHYFDCYLEYADSIQRLMQTEAVSKMHSLYNYQLREEENLRLTIQNQRKEWWLGVAVCALLVVCLLGVIYWQYGRHKRRELQQQLDKLRTIERENQTRITVLESSKAQKEELEQQLQNMDAPGEASRKKQLERRLEWLNHHLQQREIEQEQEQEAVAQLFDSDLYKLLRQRADSPRGDAYVSDEEWGQLCSLLPQAFPLFFERLHSLHTLNINELHVSILLKLRFRYADIARLLRLKPETISSIRKRLYQKVTGMSGTPEKWDKIVDSL